jgi:hypothetical protein
MLNSWLLVTCVLRAAGAAARAGAEGARRTTTVRARWCTWRAFVVAGRNATAIWGCADTASRTFEARLPATGRSATTRPPAAPKPGTRAGPFWTTPAGSRKTESEIPIPAANVAGTVGEKSANGGLMFD